MATETPGARLVRVVEEIESIQDDMLRAGRIVPAAALGRVAVVLAALARRQLFADKLDAACIDQETGKDLLISALRGQAEALR
jgi:hypothetical protein